MAHVRFAGLALAFPALLAFCSARAAEPSSLPSLSACAAIAADAERLACYDRLAAGAIPAAPAAPAAAPAAPAADTAAGNAATPPAPIAAAHDTSPLSAHWELAQDDKRGVFAFRPHQPNYLLFAQYNSSPNRQPFQPLASAVDDQETLSKTEVKFQLSFKMKLMENLFRDRADLWFGYTQQSFWQAYNHPASSPFRETDYAPELMLVMPVSYPLLGLHGRFVNLGLLHQSNGRSGTLSRSWNRVYLQTGLERGPLTLLARAWYRLPESADEDDNADITRYLGHGDLVATWRRDNGSEWRAMLRHNFSTGRGATELSYAFPLGGKVKGYVRGFSGYGESLLDYNWRENLLGFGVLVDF